MVDVEQGALGAFGQDVLALAQEGVDLVLRVGKAEAAHVVHTLHPAALVVGDVVVGEAEVFQNLFVAGFEGTVFFFEAVEDVAHAEADAGGLVAVSRADAFAGGANLALALGGLIGTVEHAVGGQDEVGALADVQACGRSLFCRLRP